MLTKSEPISSWDGIGSPHYLHELRESWKTVCSRTWPRGMELKAKADQMSLAMPENCTTKLANRQGSELQPMQFDAMVADVSLTGWTYDQLRESVSKQSACWSDRM